MIIPAGYKTEAEVLAVIDKAIRNLSQTYRFGYYDVEDMMQEGRLEALRLLEKDVFEPDRNCSLEQFIRVHVRNQFINLRRKKMERRAPPCDVCPNALDGDDFPCNLYLDRSDCKKWAGWVERNTSKKSLVESFEPSQVSLANHVEETDLVRSLVAQELLALMDEHMPIILKSDYRRYLEGVRLPKLRRLRIEEEIQNIVRDHYDQTRHEEEEGSS